MMDSEIYGMEFEIKDEVKEEVLEEAKAEDALENTNLELKSEERIDTEDIFCPSPPPTSAFELNTVKTGFDEEIQNRPRNSISNARLICQHCPKPNSFPNILRRRPNSFPTREALEEHVLKQHAAEHDNTRVEFSCFTCADRNFMDQKSRDEHIKRHHIKRFSVLLSRDRAFLEFPHCTKFLVLENDRNAHVPRDPLEIVPLATATPPVGTKMQLKILTMRLKCPHCDETFAQKFHLKRHMKRLHPEPESRVKCPHCPLTFSPTENLEFQSHMLSLHNQAGSLRLLVKCPRYDAPFCQKSQLETHIERVHSEFEPHVTSPQESFVIQDLQQIQGKGEYPDPRVKCPHCPLTFLLGQKRIFRSHMKKLHNEDCHLKSKSVQKCPQDAQTLPLKSTLPAHTETVSFGSASRIKCPRCPLTFVRDQTLKCHMRKRHKEDAIDSIVWEAEPEQEPPGNIESQLKCPHCDETFSQKGRLPNHIKRHHSGSGSQEIQCPQCPSKFSHNWSLQVHITTHHNKERGEDIQDSETEANAKKPRLKCPQCATTFSIKTGKSAFTRHMGIFHSELNHNPVLRKNCPHCDKHFLSDRSLKRHISSLHLMPPKQRKSKKQKCRYCNKVFLKPLKLRHHIIEIHIKQSKTAKNKGLPNPVITEQPSECNSEKSENSAKNQCQPSPRVPCPKCQLTFSNSKHLQFHIILQHVEKLKFPCLICTSRNEEGSSSTLEDNAEKKCKKFMFGDERSLEKHMSKIHYTAHKQNENLENPPKKVRIVMPQNKICPICSKSFYGKWAASNYRGHMLTHLGIFSYSCEHCSKKFTCRLSLQAHLIRHHNYTSEQLNFKYTCRLCPFISLNQALLNYHMGRKHPEWRPNLQLQSGEETNIDPDETELILSDGNSQSKNMTENSTQSAMCFVCSKIQTSKLDLIQHLKGHRGEGRFYCDLCPRDFSVRTHLTAHLNLDHHKSAYCNKCFTSFTDAVARNQHVLHTDVLNANGNQSGGSPVAAIERSPASNLKCEICDESFKSLCLLKIHTISHLKEIQQQKMNFPDDQVVSADNIFKCTSCTSSFDRQLYLNAHLEIVHKHELENTLFKCSKCERSYKFINELKYHDIVVHSLKINQGINQKRLDSSDGEFSFECSICLSKFETQSELESHQNQFGSEVLCHICPATFNCKSRLNTHLRTIHGETDESNRSKIFLCHICPSKFVHGHSLRRHVQHIHEGLEYEAPGKAKSKTKISQTFSCRLCPEKFSRVSDLRCHGRKVHETKYNMSLDFRCHLCSCKYTRDQDLQRHVQRMHGSKSSSTTRNVNPENVSDETIPFKKDKGFPCKLCSIVFVKKNGLLFHISDYHTDDALKPFQCNICQRKYNAENILKVHMYDSHKRVPYFRCEVCFVRILRRFRLRQHLKEEHNRPEYCETCKRSFETRADVDKHLEKNPSKTFPCRTCQTDYPSECLLTKHCNKLKHD